MSLHHGDVTAHVRVKAINKELIYSYFDLPDKTLNVHGLTDSPGQLYNIDKSVIPTLLISLPNEDRRKFNTELQATKIKAQ